MNEEIVTLDGEMPSPLSTRLRQARKDAGLTQQELADRAGLAQATISKMESGQISQTTEILTLARVLGVNPDWLARGIGPKEKSSPSEVALGSEDFPAIRRVEMKVTAGISGFSIEPLQGEEDPIAFRADWFAKRGYRPDALYALSVGGNSMEPGLSSGDTVVINTLDRQPTDGGVFAINYEGELVIKRLFRIGATWVANSDNLDKHRHPDRPMHEGAFIVGKVVHKQSERL